MAPGWPGRGARGSPGARGLVLAGVGVGAGGPGQPRLTFYELEPAAESRAGPPGRVPTWEGHGEPRPGSVPSQFRGFSQKPMVWSLGDSLLGL